MAERIQTFVSNLQKSYDILHSITDDLKRKAQKCYNLIQINKALTSVSPSLSIIQKQELDQLTSFIQSPENTEKIFHLKNIYETGIEALKLKELEVKALLKDNPNDERLKVLNDIIIDFLYRAKTDYSKALDDYMNIVQEIGKNKIKSVAVIMDGNRRWAKENNTNELTAYKQGLKKCIECLEWCVERGIQNLAVFAFSIENWSRSDNEIKQIQSVLKTLYEEYGKLFLEMNVRVRFVGQLERFDKEIQNMFSKLENETKNGKKCVLWVCVSYGGQQEIIEGVKQLINRGEPVENLEKMLWTSELPDIDILIRTSGEKRLSGFLLWKLSYAELFFVDKLWPDMTEETFDEVLVEFSNRNRRMGK